MPQTLTISPETKALFDRDGFVIIRGFFAPEEVRELTEVLDRFIAEVVPTVPPADAFYEIKGRPETLKQMQRMGDHEPFFRDLPRHERLVRLGEMLLDDTLISHGVEWFNKPAGVGKATPPHQDGYYFKLEPNVALTYWIPLDVVDESNGCLRYIPGSHHRPVRPHARTETLGFSQGITDYGPADARAEHLVKVKPGDLVVHHSMTIHRADANPSTRPRRALGLVYHASRAKQDMAEIEAYHAKLLADLGKAGKI